MGVYDGYSVVVHSNSEDELDRFMAYLNLKLVRVYAEAYYTEFQSDRLRGLIRIVELTTNEVKFRVSYRAFSSSVEEGKTFFKRLRVLKLFPTLHVTIRYVRVHNTDMTCVDGVLSAVEDASEDVWVYANGCVFELLDERCTDCTIDQEIEEDERRASECVNEQQISLL